GVNRDHQAGSTETPDTAELGQGEAADLALACKLHHQMYETLYIRVRYDPSSAHRMKTPRTYPAALEIRAGEEVDVGFVWRGVIPALILGPNHLRNVVLSTVLSVVLINVLTARLHIRPPTRGRALTLPPDIRALHPRPSSASGCIA
ncbi:hypothetical protein PIB30_105468, partial [Stylosanthes scabra]|nr:hypothetical protein [Stylosanthes scabra]